MKKNLLLSPLLLLSLIITSCDFDEPKEIGGEGEEDKIAVQANSNVMAEKISFKSPNLGVVVGKPTKLDVTFSPSNVTDQELTYSISDPSFGTISDDGVLVATKCGNFEVTAFAKNGVYSSCTIYAGSGPVESISTVEEIILDLSSNPEQEITYNIYPKDSFQCIRFDIGNKDIATIIDNRVIGRQLGQTEIVIYDDSNHNERRDGNEKYISTDLIIHDVSEISRKVDATHTFDGEIVYKCKCGCGKEKKEVIPALGHNFGEPITLLEPTCTEPGCRQTKCQGCDYTIEETLPALGHNHVEVVKDDNIAKLGDIVSKTEYYYTCDRCNQLVDKTFKHGHHDDFYAERIPEYFDNDEDKATKYQKAVMNTLNKFEEYKNKTFEKRFHVSYKNLSIGFGTATHLVKVGASARGTYPWVHSNVGNWTTTSVNNVFSGLYVVSANDYNIDLEKRQRDMAYFDAIHEETDQLIRKDATDAEKALIILLYTAKYITYKYIYFFYTTVATREGLCHCYAYMVSHLAHRYNLPCIYDAGNSHAWNNVCIDGTWYLLDATWSDTNLKYFLRENGAASNHKVNNTTTLVKTTSSLKYKLVQLYKNNEMAGIYYDVNTALDQIDDSSADYRLVLGIGTDGVLGLTLNKDCYYYLDSYQTNKTSINCKSLSIEKCETYGQGKTPTFKAPASLLNQGNISFKTVTSSAS